VTSTLALAIVVDASVALGLALLVCRALQHRPAALRHWVLAASLAVAAAAPLLEIALPQLELPLLPGPAPVTSGGSALSSEPAPMATPAPVPAQAPARIGWIPMLAFIWAVGCGLLLVSLLTGIARLMWMTRRCRPVRSTVWRERADALSAQYGLRRPVEIVESRDRALLVTWGLMRPRIIVPAAAAVWSAERIDVVLAHELAHIVRCDWALQVGAEALRAVHWFNPLMWIACRQLRDESEHACDDFVLRRGVDAAHYATHLLAIARHVLTAGGGWASAPAVAHASTLERRIGAMLNPSSNRKPVTRRARLAALTVTVAMAVPVAAATLTERIEETLFVPAARQDIALEPAPPAITRVPIVQAPVARRAAPRVAPATPAADAQDTVTISAVVLADGAARVAPAQQKPASVSGTVRDSQGGVMPGVRVELNDASGTLTWTVTDSNGQFIFRNVGPGKYQFTARLAGFSTATDTLDLAAGQDLLHNRTLAIGRLAETIVVTCRPAGAALRRGETVPALSLARHSTATRLFPTVRDVGHAQAAFAAQGLPVRVGGQIMAPRQVKKVNPRCPAVTPGAGLVVILEGAIGADGLVKDVKVLRPQPADDKQTGYVQAAVEAVRQWEYTPTRLNNVPVPVIMTVTVSFVVSASPN
jgi:beta-lactamase regulating signal transducer with metallopeptidase domain